MVDFVNNMAMSNWLVFGILFLALELLWGRGYCFWLALIAGLVGFLQKLLPIYPGYAQVVTFGLLSLVFLLAWSRLLKSGARLQRPGMDNFNIAKGCMGKTVTLKRSMRKLQGKVELEGRTWRVRAKENFKKGTQLVVSGHDGVVLIAKRED